MHPNHQRRRKREILKQIYRKMERLQMETRAMMVQLHSLDFGLDPIAVMTHECSSSQGTLPENDNCVAPCDLT